MMVVVFGMYTVSIVSVLRSFNALRRSTSNERVNWLNLLCGGKATTMRVSAWMDELKIYSKLIMWPCMLLSLIGNTFQPLTHSGLYDIVDHAYGKPCLFSGEFNVIGGIHYCTLGVCDYALVFQFGDILCESLWTFVFCPSQNARVVFQTWRWTTAEYGYCTS